MGKEVANQQRGKDPARTRHKESTMKKLLTYPLYALIGALLGTFASTIIIFVVGTPINFLFFSETSWINILNDLIIFIGKICFFLGMLIGIIFAWREA